MFSEASSTILIVDDNPDNLRVLGSILTAAGLTVRAATSGALALRSVAARHPDLVLVDVMMPGMDGFEVCRRLRDDPPTAEIPVIFLSALTDPADKVKAFEAGGVDYVTKPFSEQEILARVRTHLRLADAKRSLEVMNAELRATIAERERLEAELRCAEKLQAIGRLAAGMAHEISTPAQFARDNLTFLGQSFGALLDLVRTYRSGITALPESRARDELLVAATSAEEDADLGFLEVHVPEAIHGSVYGITRIARIVASLKEFAGSSPLGADEVDLNGIIDRAVAATSRVVEKVARVETELGQLPPVRGDAHEIQQVVMNLLVNAAQAIGPVAEARGGQGHIRLATRLEDTYARIDLEDDGCGIPEAIRDRVFEPFFTTKEVGTASGEGLSVAWGVVEKHRGKLTFESEVGRGTRFTVHLPVAGVGA